jgi:hypothetical protein
MNYLLGHLVGDYIFQNDWMAQNKKNNSVACLAHCSLYSLAVFLFTSWTWWAILIVFVSHFLLDRWNFVKWWMTKTGQAGFASPPMAPWSIIIVDNTIHLLVLFWVSWLTSWI